ncbi:MAG: formylglycine-generating enzyme family protein [Myxococcota bacterium]|nr:formylglycine-generating enzyme family protein [Myxococcota bacterium]
MRSLSFAGVLMLGIGCSPQPEPPPDSGETGLEIEDDPCAPEGFPSGQAVGESNCEEGICSIPPGPFWRGQANNGDADACPLHVVEMSAYRIDEFETSMGDYNDCVDAGSCSQRDSECNSIYSNWKGDRDALPVVCVDHAQALAYCEWKGGRLPSEAEWEKAARGEEGATYPWGERAPLCEDGNFRFVSWYCQQSVVEVGSYPETTTAYGLQDTLGNAWEWTSDYYDSTWYQEASRTDPGGPEQCSIDPSQEKADCTHRVIRGGGFNATEQNTRASARSLSEPDRADVNLGFRCAYD